MKQSSLLDRVDRSIDRAAKNLKFRQTRRTNRSRRVGITLLTYTLSTPETRECRVPFSRLGGNLSAGPGGVFTFTSSSYPCICPSIQILILTHIPSLPCQGALKATERAPQRNNKGTRKSCSMDGRTSHPKNRENINFNLPIGLARKY
jgi:hypothetical protein